MADGGDDDVGFDPDLFIDREYRPRPWRFRDLEVTILALETAATDFDLTGQVVWPAADALSHYIACYPGLFAGRRVLEVGSGVGICGLLAGHCGPAELVVTDHNDVVMDVLEQNVALNFPDSSTVTAAKLDWAHIPESVLGDREGAFDIILGSDVVHWPASVEPLLDTILFFLARSPDARFLNAFRPRSTLIHDTLLREADRRGLEHREHKPESFMPDEPSAAGADSPPDTNAPEILLYEFRRRE